MKLILTGHGEGGELVSQYCMSEIQKRLEKHASFPSDMEDAFKKTFVEVDESLAHRENLEPLYSGTTACVVVMREGQLHIANVGDSRAVIGRKKKYPNRKTNREYDSFDLTVDQNPDSPGEKERIVSCGGFVSPPPEVGLSARVWLDKDFNHIGLAMSRSLGDHAVKGVGVTAEPVVTSHTLSDDDEFLVIATDGVWEFIESDEAIGIVERSFERGEGASNACKILIEAAAQKWKEHEGSYRDDITAVVLRLKELWDIDGETLSNVI